MRNWPQRIRKSSRIEIIPMIDVMMFLLVFFVLISINALPSLGLKVTLPYASDPSHLEAPRRITLTLMSDGAIYLDGASIELGDVAARLSEMAKSSKLTIIIAGDRDSHLQLLVSLLGALKQAGIPAATIVTRQQ